MSNGFLYHVHVIRGYEHARIDYKGGQTMFTIRQDPTTCRCSACGSARVQSRGQVERHFRTLPVASRPTVVILPIPRVECQACGVVRQVKVSFADPRQSYTKSKLKHPRRIAIHEIAVAKGHRYLTVVMDSESGAVVFVGDGEGADALKPFWKRPRPSGAKIEAIAMDMSVAYRSAVSIHVPKAKIVFDHLHVVKRFNEKLSNLRRALYREATE